MRARRASLRRRISRRVAPITSPALSQSLGGIAIVGVGLGLPAHLIGPIGQVMFYIGLAGMIALFTLCAIVIPDDFDRVQTERAERRAQRAASKAAARAAAETRASEAALPDPAEG